VHGFPYACISLGLIDQRIPVLGVIYNPFLDHLYTGVRGAGSFLRTPTQPEPQRLPLAPARPLPSLASALIAVEWGSNRKPEAMHAKAQSFTRLAGAPPHGVMAHSLHSMGSAALNFSLVAQGALDMYWFVSLFLFGTIWLTEQLGHVTLREVGCWYVSALVARSPVCSISIADRVFRPWDVCVRISPYVYLPSSAPGELTHTNLTGGHGDRARGRRLRHGL